jgi:predicted nuclease with TOPRIM domain
MERNMKNCTNCQTELPTALDEYGPFLTPLCRGCFDKTQEETPNNIKRLEDEIEDLEEDARSIQSEIDDLEGDLYDKKNDIRKLKNKIEELKNPAKVRPVTRFDDLPIFQVH